ncbi:P-loop containing nucleoside triphosphate hydrolase protein [Suillus americanus]|nr:P-loop containing nucleoside triphosphate hydrolase protein [Suillus americanus]
MINLNVRHYLALKVIASTNLPVSSDRTPIGNYVRVFTSNNGWNTTIKAAEADHSVSWNELLNIYGLRRTVLQRLFSRTSEKIRLEIRASYESESELVCEFETTFERLLVEGDGQSITLSAIKNQNISLTLKAQRSTQATHAPSRSPELEQTRPRERNVVIFGETGSGKSSLINRITQHVLAEISNDALGCTSTSERYPVEISGGKYVLIDTPGLNEGSVGRVPDAEAKKLLRNLLRELMSSRSDDIGLLVYCVRSTTRPRTFVKAFNKVYSDICHKRVPIILVVEGWTNEQKMKSWWIANGMQCNNHDSEPSGFLRNLIAKYYEVNTSQS